MFPLRGRIVRFWAVLARTPRRATAVALVGLLLIVGVATGAALLMGGSAAAPSGPAVDAPESAVVNGTNGTGALTTSGTLLLELRSTGNTTVAYRFEVEGTVEKTTIGASDVAADPEDELAVQDNGTTVVNGSIGEDGGDAYVVNGTITSSTVTNASDVLVLLTANVTAQFVNESAGGPDDRSGDGGDDGSNGTTGDDGGTGDGVDDGGDDEGGDVGGDDSIGDDDSNGAAGGDDGNGDVGTGDGSNDEGDDEGDNDGGDIGNGDDDGDDDGDDSIQTIDSCTVIDEPGSYELGSDLGDGPTLTDFDIVGNAPTCLHVNESDVVIDGNGHAIVNEGGAGDGIGVYIVSGRPISGPGNVTVRNVAVRGWSDGISAGWHMGDAVGPEVRIENVEASDNDMGVSLNGPSDSTVVDSDVSGNARGIHLLELSNARISDVEVHDNTDGGISLGQGAVRNQISDVSVRDNGDSGISYSGSATSHNTISDSIIANNANVGVDIYGDTRNNTIEGTTIESNGVAGVRVGDETAGTSGVAIRGTEIRDNGADGVHFVSGTEDSRLTSVTVSGHDGTSLRTDEGELDASEFRLADAWSFDFVGEGVTLSHVAQDDLPALPDGQTPLQDGVDVAGVEDRVMATFDVTGSVGTDTEVQLVRHDGTEWSSVATVEPDELAGSVQQELTEDGTYAVVEVDAAPATFTVADLDPAETSVAQDAAVTVSATVENVGDTAGTQDVALRVGDTVVAEQQLELNETELEVVSFTNVPVEDFEPGTYEHGVFTDDGGATGSLTVQTANDTDTPTPTDTPIETSTDTPTETPTDTPMETPTDTPTEMPTETPTETPPEAPTETPTETPTDTSTETPPETPTDTPT